MFLKKALLWSLLSLNVFAGQYTTEQNNCYIRSIEIQHKSKELILSTPRTPEEVSHFKLISCDRFYDDRICRYYSQQSDEELTYFDREIIFGGEKSFYRFRGCDYFLDMY